MNAKPDVWFGNMKRGKIIVDITRLLSEWISVSSDVFNYQHHLYLNLLSEPSLGATFTSWPPSSQRSPTDLRYPSSHPISLYPGHSSRYHPASGGGSQTDAAEPGPSSLSCPGATSQAASSKLNKKRCASHLSAEAAKAKRFPSPVAPSRLYHGVHVAAYAGPSHLPGLSNREQSAACLVDTDSESGDEDYIDVLGLSSPGGAIGGARAPRWGMLQGEPSAPSSSRQSYTPSLSEASTEDLPLPPPTPSPTLSSVVDDLPPRLDMPPIDPSREYVDLEEAGCSHAAIGRHPVQDSPTGPSTSGYSSAAAPPRSDSPNVLVYSSSEDSDVEVVSVEDVEVVSVEHKK